MSETGAWGPRPKEKAQQAKSSHANFSDFLIVTYPRNSTAEGLVQETVQHISTFVQSLCHAMSFAKSCELLMHVLVLIYYIRMTLDKTYKTDYLPFLKNNSTWCNCLHAEVTLPITPIRNFSCQLLCQHSLNSALYGNKKNTDPEQAHITKCFYRCYIIQNIINWSADANSSIQHICAGKVLHWWLSGRYKDSTPGKKHRSETKIYAGIMKWYLHFAGDWCQLHLQRKKNTKSFQKVYEKQEWLLIIRCCMQIGRKT